jgi:hypothetical protein
MDSFLFIAPSEWLLLKVLAMGFFFGWTGRAVMKPRIREVSNMKFVTFKEASARIKL